MGVAVYQIAIINRFVIMFMTRRLKTDAPGRKEQPVPVDALSCGVLSRHFLGPTVERKVSDKSNHEPLGLDTIKGIEDIKCIDSDDELTPCIDEGIKIESKTNEPKLQSAEPGPTDVKGTPSSVTPSSCRGDHRAETSHDNGFSSTSKETADIYNTVDIGSYENTFLSLNRDHDCYSDQGGDELPESHDEADTRALPLDEVCLHALSLTDCAKNDIGIGTEDRRRTSLSDSLRRGAVLATARARRSWGSLWRTWRTRNAVGHPPPHSTPF